MTGVRKVYLAMLVNLGFLLTLTLGLIFYIRFSLQHSLYFLMGITHVIVLSLAVMFIEAFALYVPTQDRAFIFYVNIPIVIDIGFVIVFWVIHCKYFRPLAKIKEESEKKK